MNAHKVADDLQECIDDGSTDLVCVQEAAILIRQQADELNKLVPQLVKANGIIENLRLRIAELEKLLEHSVGSDCREMRHIQEIENKNARIAELEKLLQESAMHNISVTSQADEHYAKVKELAQKLSAYIIELELQKAMVQDLEKQLAFMEGEYPEPTIAAKIKEFASLEQAYNKITKYEQALQAIANDYHELSDYKIEVQNRNHKKWAKEALE